MSLPAQHHERIYLTREYELELIRKSQRGDRSALAELCHSCEWMVGFAARPFTWLAIDVDDLMQDGRIGLVMAIHKFKPKFKARLSTFALPWIRSVMYTHVLRRPVVGSFTSRDGRAIFFNAHRARHALSNELGREPTNTELAKRLGVSADTIGAYLQRLNPGSEIPIDPCGGSWDDCNDSPAYQAQDTRPLPDELAAETDEHAKRLRLVRAALFMLPERDRHVIEQCWLTDTPKTLADVGRELGLSRERIRQIEGKALGRIRIAVGVIDAKD